MALENHELTRFFLALLLLLMSAHVCGYCFRRAGFPRVIGEIGGGLLLGPTGIGYVFPGIYTWVFAGFPAEGKMLSAMSWFGLIFLMFVSGFEMRRDHDRRDTRIIIGVAAGSTVIPFLAGWFLPAIMNFNPFIGIKENVIAFKIIIALAMAVTSIPVISRIFIDLNIMNSRFAQVILTTATIHDVILWSALAVATGLVSSEGLTPLQICGTILVTVVFFCVTLGLGHRLLDGIDRYVTRQSSETGYALLVCFIFVVLASFLDVNIVFGALLAGIVINRFPSSSTEQFKEHIKNMSLSFFIPLYFSLVGLKLDLVNYLDIVLTVIFIAMATIVAVTASLISSRFMRLEWLTSMNIAVAMNTRGGPGIVVATVAFELGIISQTGYAAMILLAMTTTLMAGSWFKMANQRGWQLDAGFGVSGPPAV